MEKLRQKNISEINRLNDIVAEEEDFTRRTQSLLKEAAENEKLALAAAHASEAITQYNKLQKRNENLKDRERKARTAYIEEQERQKQQEIEQQKIEEMERQKHINENQEPEIENETMTNQETDELQYN